MMAYKSYLLCVFLFLWWGEICNHTMNWMKINWHIVSWDVLFITSFKFVWITIQSNAASILVHVRFSQMILKKNISMGRKKMQILIKVYDSDLWQNVNKEKDYFSKLNYVEQNTRSSFYFQYDCPMNMN